MIEIKMKMDSYRFGDSDQLQRADCIVPINPNQTEIESKEDGSVSFTFDASKSVDKNEAPCKWFRFDFCDEFRLNTLIWERTETSEEGDLVAGDSYHYL